MRERPLEEEHCCVRCAHWKYATNIADVLKQQLRLGHCGISRALTLGTYVCGDYLEPRSG